MAANSIFPALMAFYLGAWIDIFGRKRVIFLYVFTNVIDFGGLLLNAIFIRWPLEILIPSTIFESLVGKFLDISIIFIICIYLPQIYELQISESRTY